MGDGDAASGKYEAKLEHQLFSSFTVKRKAHAIYEEPVWKSKEKQYVHIKGQ